MYKGLIGISRKHYIEYLVQNREDYNDFPMYVHGYDRYKNTFDKLIDNINTVKSEFYTDDLMCDDCVDYNTLTLAIDHQANNLEYSSYFDITDLVAQETGIVFTNPIFLSTNSLTMIADLYVFYINYQIFSKHWELNTIFKEDAYSVNLVLAYTLDFGILVSNEETIHQHFGYDDYEEEVDNYIKTFLKLDLNDENILKLFKEPLTIRLLFLVLNHKSYCNRGEEQRALLTSRINIILTKVGHGISDNNIAKILNDTLDNFNPKDDEEKELLISWLQVKEDKAIKRVEKLKGRREALDKIVSGNVMKLF